MNKKQVNDFVSRTLLKYDMTWRMEDYFDRDEELNLEDWEGWEEWEDRRLFKEDVLDEEILKELSVKLGMTREELLNTDEEAADRYLKKYPYFKFIDEYQSKHRWYHMYRSEWVSAEDILLHAIFGEPLKHEDRYDWESIKDRMVEELKQIDELMPGTYHENATITDLVIHTGVFFSFPKIKEMLYSFLDMVSRFEELFFKGMREELPTDEENEYNFLASYLDARDVAMPSVVVTYDVLRFYKDVYIEEGFDNLYLYIKFKNVIQYEPWCCQEFVDDMELVKKFAYVFPQVKAKMHEAIMEVTKFLCRFVWSDAKPIIYSDDYDPESKALDKLLGIEEVPFEERAKEVTSVYVPKTEEEMFGWEPFVEKLRQAASPETDGGLAIRKIDPNNIAPAIIYRTERRVDVKNGGSK